MQGEFRGHSAESARRIAEAREHYDTRRDRRPIQVWRHPETGLLLLPGEKLKGAIPDKEEF